MNSYNTIADFQELLNQWALPDSTWKVVKVEQEEFEVDGTLEPVYRAQAESIWNEFHLKDIPKEELEQALIKWRKIG